MSSSAAQVPFEALFHAAPTPFVVIAPPEWTIIAANEARLRVTSTTLEDQIGRKLFDVFPDDPDDPEADGVRMLTASLERVMTGRVTDVMNVQRYNVREPDGRFVERWWSPINSPVLGDDGEVAYIIHRVEDVTEVVKLRGDAAARDQLARDQQAVIERLRQSEMALRGSEERTRRIVDGVKDHAIFIINQDGVVVDWTLGAEAAFGWPAAEIVGQPFELLFTPEDRAAGVPAQELLEAGQTGYASDDRWHIRRDGSRFFVNGSVRPLHDTAGEITGFIKIARDETERRAIEARLHASEEQLRLATEAGEIGLWDLDVTTDTLFWPTRVKAMFGISPDVPISMADYFAGLHPEDAEQTAAAFEAALDPERRAVYDVEYRTIGKEDRLVRWVAARGRGQFDANGRCVRVIGTAVDITRRKGTEEQLRELNATLETRVAKRTAERDRTWNNSRDLLIVIGVDGIIHSVNPAWTTILGWRPDELAGRSYVSFLHPDDRPSSEIARVVAGLEPLPVFENRYRHIDGSYRWISWVSAPDGEFIYGSGRDVTGDRAREAELEVAQEALRQVQKMEAMGQLTGGVAHDFNNLLTPIVGSLDMLRRKGVGGEREQRLIDGAIQSADRAKTLVHRLLSFARRQPLQATAVDMIQLVTGMVGLIESTTGPQIKVVVDAGGDLPSALADVNQLEMALLNLAVNARDAMPDGGTLRVGLTQEAVGQGHPASLRPGDYIRLSVADTGVGMDDETMARAVEPFFSTKGVGKGTGLGLSSAHGLASQLGGGLTIRSHRGVGTTIEMWLPVSSHRAESASSFIAMEPAPIAAGTVLLVDDEDLVRMSTADMLGDLGYKVVEATSAEEALGLVRGGLTPDLLVTDHLMPGMTGTDLARSVRVLLPSLQILLVSGYAESDGVALELARLRKPFTRDEMAASLSSLSQAPK